MNNDQLQGIDYCDKTVLITGGTGSFGSTVARRMLANGIGQVRIFSRDEAKQDAMRQDLDDDRARFYIGDVRSLPSVERAMSGVDLVFHAAALKQVPSCEFFPMEAVATNVLGSQNVINSAEASGVRNVVCLSTDKAVYPVNAMGMSKAMMEKVAQSHSRIQHDPRTVIACVRYGNVMYSRGSVLPLFIRQLKQGKDLTITDEGMTRFMMSLPESVSLVEFALAHAIQGDVYIQKAPAAKMSVVAEAMIELFHSSVGIRTIGIRNGEKLHETLATREEMLRSTDYGGYLRLPVDAPALNYDKFFEKGVTARANSADFDSATTRLLSKEEMMEKLLTLPEVRQELELAGILQVGSDGVSGSVRGEVLTSGDVPVQAIA